MVRAIILGGGNTSLKLSALFGLAGAICAMGQPLQLSYTGTAGWIVTDGKTTVLVDPYLSRLKVSTPNDRVLEDDPRPLASIKSEPDRDVIDAHITRANFILITHTHFDHSFDMPYIARKTGAVVIGTQSTANLAEASGVPTSQLHPVKGGEDLALPGVSVRVIPSLHGLLPGLPIPPPVFPAGATPPFRLGQYVEGGTLAYLVTMSGEKMLFFGSMNYIESEVTGLRPDVAMIGAMPERNKVENYTARLMRALGNPPFVLPTHWDRFNVPYGVSQQPAVERLQSFIDEVKAASPDTKVIVPGHFKPITLGKVQTSPRQR